MANRGDAKKKKSEKNGPPMEIKRQLISTTTEVTRIRPFIASAADLSSGCRMRIYKQDPSVGINAGIREVYLPIPIQAGPRDKRVIIQGMPQVSPDTNGDYFAEVGTDEFDAVHTFAVVRMTLQMYERALTVVNGKPTSLQWIWNKRGSLRPIAIYPNKVTEYGPHYDNSTQSISLGLPPELVAKVGKTVYPCRSLDIVAHETGHAILDGLKPGWSSAIAPIESGGLHEAFGDLTAIFLVLSQLDMVEAVIAQTKANLHQKSFLSALAEQFGAEILGLSSGLRSALNTSTLSQVRKEVHDISEVFTGAVYDIMADIFQSRRDPGKVDDAAVLLDTGTYMRGLLVKAIIASPERFAKFADVAQKMLDLTSDASSSVEHRIIAQRFSEREIYRGRVEALMEFTDGGQRMMVETGAANMEVLGEQNRSHCCSTMRHSLLK